MDAIKMVGIVKCFGPVRANDGIDFTVKHQEIHCLLVVFNGKILLILAD